MDRKPVVAIAVSGALLTCAAAAAVLTTGAASATASLEHAVPAAAAPPGRIMGTPVKGLGATVHTIKVDEHGRAEAFVIRRVAWHGLKTELVRVSPADLIYLPDRERLAARS